MIHGSSAGLRLVLVSGTHSQEGQSDKSEGRKTATLAQDEAKQHSEEESGTVAH